MSPIAEEEVFGYLLKFDGITVPLYTRQRVLMFPS